MILRLFKKLILSIFIFILLSSIGIMAFINLSPQFGSSPSGDHLEKISRSANYAENKFINLIPTSMDMNARDMWETMRDFAVGGKDRSPVRALPTRFENNHPSIPDTLAQIVWYGHSAISLEIDGKLILIDPMLGKTASPVPFMTKRFVYSNSIDIAKIENVDAVILSHDHYDHLDYPSIVQLQDKVAHFYTPLGVGSHLKRWGVEESKITELDWWESAKLEQINLVATPARHFSGRALTDRNKTQWASWVVQGSKESIYFSGDSGYGPHFKEIGEKYGPFEFAMMECGQYNEKWEAIHMMPEQTVQASLDVRAERMMPIHWSAFNLALHSWTDPVERALKAANTHGVDIIVPFIGERFAPGRRELKISPWWNNL